MAEVLSRQTEIIESGRYQDKRTRLTVGFSGYPTMQEIKEAANAAWGFWEEELPQGAFLMRHVYGVIRTQVFGQIRCEIYICDPFTD